MPKEYSPTKKLKGIATVELVLALSVFSMLVLGLIGSVAYANEAASAAGFRNKASMLAQEGLEAVRSLRDVNYSNLTDGTFGLNGSGSTWALSGTNDTTEIYTRQIQISTLSATTKQIRSTVTWSQLPAGSVTFTEILSNWRRSVPIGDWATITQTYAMDLSGTNDGWRVRVQGNYAYIIRNATTANFVIVDISGTTPSLVSTLNLGDRPYELEVSGNYAYIANASNNQELQIVNITNPAAPSIAAAYNASGNTDGIALTLTGSKVILGRPSGMLIIDVTTPTTPVLNSSLALSGNPNGIVVIGNYAYFGTNSSSSEVQIVNITNPLLPVSAGSLNLSGSRVINSLVSSGTNLLAGCSDGTFFILNAANPTTLTTTGSLSLGAAAINNIALNVNSSLAFVASSLSTAEFQVVNLTNLASPTLKSSLNVSSSLNGVFYVSSRNEIYAVGLSNTEELIKLNSN